MGWTDIWSVKNGQVGASFRNIYFYNSAGSFSKPNVNRHFLLSPVLTLPPFSSRCDHAENHDHVVIHFFNQRGLT